MTTNQQRLLDLLLHDLGDTSLPQAVERLLIHGLLNERALEHLAICRQVQAEEQAGCPRCEAFEKVADRFHCSYGKVRNAFYEQEHHRFGPLSIASH